MDEHRNAAERLAGASEPLSDAGHDDPARALRGRNRRLQDMHVCVKVKRWDLVVRHTAEVQEVTPVAATVAQRELNGRDPFPDLYR